MSKTRDGIERPCDRNSHWATDLRKAVVVATANLKSYVCRIGNLGGERLRMDLPNGDGQTDGQTADARMASATAVAGREFYWEYWEIGIGLGASTTNDVCNWTDYTYTRKLTELGRLQELGKWFSLHVQNVQIGHSTLFAPGLRKES